MASPSNLHPDAKGKESYLDWPEHYSVIKELLGAKGKESFSDWPEHYSVIKELYGGGRIESFLSK